MDFTSEKWKRDMEKFKKRRHIPNESFDKTPISKEQINIFITTRRSKVQ